METRRLYRHSKRLRCVAALTVVLLVIGYLLSGRVGVMWVGSTRASPSVWIADGSIGYNSDSPAFEKYGSGLAQLPLGSAFHFDGDFDCRERNGLWFINVALWPLPLAAVVAMAWLCRWRTVAVGACEKCGYPLEGRALCPECGRSARHAVT